MINEKRDAEQLKKEITALSQKLHKSCDELLNEEGHSEKFYAFVKKLKETNIKSEKIHIELENLINPS